MSEEIIRHGVDISGCTSFDTHDMTTCKLMTKINGFPSKCSCYSQCGYKQLQRAKQENEELKNLSLEIRKTDIYSNVCCECKDEILIYPNISGRTEYSQSEVELRALKQIIQRYNELKESNKILNRDWEDKKNENYNLAIRNEKLKSKLTIATDALKKMSNLDIAQQALEQIEEGEE